jgi:hypothetical protein
MNLLGLWLKGIVPIYMAGSGEGGIEEISNTNSCGGPCGGLYFYSPKTDGQ